MLIEVADARPCGCGSRGCLERSVSLVAGVQGSKWGSICDCQSVSLMLLALCGRKGITSVSMSVLLLAFWCRKGIASVSVSVLLLAFDVERE